MALVDATRTANIGWLTLNRPEKLNALSTQMLDDFDSVLADLAGDDAVNVIVIHGAGRAFCVGYDVSGDDPDQYGESERRRSIDDWNRLRVNLERWLTVWRCPKPVVAAVHGYCMGGATQLAVCADLTVVAEDAVVGWPSLPLGGGLLGPVSAWLIGPKKAKELSYIAGSTMSGTEATAFGWANHAVPSDQVLDAADRLARQVAKTPLELLQVKKRAINRMMDVQGFSEAVLFGAEFDAIAHDSDAVDEIRDRIAEVGLKAAVAEFAEGGA